MRELASLLANPFGHPSQVRTQVLVSVDLHRLVSPFCQDFIITTLYMLASVRIATFDSRLLND